MSRSPDAATPTAGQTPGLRRRDAAALANLDDVVSVHPYTAHWYSNATFVLPLLAALGTLIAWAATGSGELLGISIFFAVVTLIMLPLVYLTWARTPTVIVLRRDGVDAWHQGRLLKRLAWRDVSDVRRKETMGNVRWYVVGRDEEHLSIEGEFAELEALLAGARRLARLPAPTEAP